MSAMSGSGVSLPPVALAGSNQTFDLVTGSPMSPAADQASLSPLSPSRRFSGLTEGGIRQSALTLISTAIGGGVLSVSYVLSIAGLGLGSLMIMASALVAYLSIVALMELSAKTGLGTYASIFAKCAGRWGEPVLDIQLFIVGNGVCIGYLVFLADFIPTLLSLTGAPVWVCSRTFAIFLSAAIIVLPACQKELGRLKAVAPFSMIALAYVTIVIVAQAPFRYVPVNQRPDLRDLPYFRFNIQSPVAFSMCVFAFNCHINVVPVATGLVRPTNVRIRKISFGVNMSQACFYLIMAVAGHLSFVENTPQNILNGYSEHDTSIIIARLLLTISILISLPMNLIPAVRSGMQFIDRLRARRNMLRPVNPRRLNAIPILPVHKRPETSTQISTATLDSSTVTLAANKIVMVPTARTEWPISFRVLFVLVCVALQVFVAIVVPGVAVVISLIGGTIATSMIMVMPGYCISIAMPRTPLNIAKQAVLWTFALLSFASVPINILTILRVIDET